MSRMTDTPPSSSSWVYLSGIYSNPQSPRRMTPVPFGGDQDYLRMLREAQKEMFGRVSPISSALMSARVSPISSARVSLASTGCRTTPIASPKSPPNSPNTDLTDMTEELKGVHINKLQMEADSNSLVWDLCSRPNLCPPTAGRLARSKSTSSSGNVSVKSEGGWSGWNQGTATALLVSNLVSLLLGVAVGLWIYKKGTTSSMAGIR